MNCHSKQTRVLNCCYCCCCWRQICYFCCLYPLASHVMLTNLKTYNSTTWTVTALNIIWDGIYCSQENKSNGNLNVFSYNRMMPRPSSQKPVLLIFILDLKRYISVYFLWNRKSSHLEWLQTVMVFSCKTLLTGLTRIMQLPLENSSQKIHTLTGYNSIETQN